MGSGGEVRGTVPSPPDTGKSPLHHIFKDAISAILTSESVGPSLLRSLYAFLRNFTLRTSLAVSYQQDILKLSSILFNDLEDRFKQYFVSLKEFSKCSTAREKTARPSLEFWCQIEELVLLLRCCLATLTWPSFDQSLVLEKAKFLLSILRRLISFDVSGRNGEQLIIFRKFRRKRTYDDDNGYTTSVVEDFFASLRFFEPTDPCCSSLCALLEVFADELLAAESLRKCFVCVESALSWQPLFKINVSSSEIELVLEVICAHLILLVSDEQAVENALDRLNRQHMKEPRFPELSVSGALNLLLNPILLSAPQLFQAHLILLVSEAIDADMSQQTMGLHVREIDFYFIAFEKSLYMYKRHISSYWDDIPLGYRASFSYSCPLERSLPSFRSCIKLVTEQKLDLLEARSESLWSLHMQNKPSESKDDLLSTSIAYIKENAGVLEESCRDEMSSVLISLTLRAFSDAPCDGSLYMKQGGSPKDIYLLSSILRLMSNSMMRIVWCLRHGGNNGRLNELKDFSSCRVYELLLGAMRCSQQFNVHLPVQSSFCKMMRAHPICRHKESNWMLLQFSGLLSLCFVGGFDFLVKACLSVMAALLNLIIFEEGSLLALRSQLRIGHKSSAFGHSCGEEEAAGEQRSSEKRKRSSQIASTFLKIQRHCSCIQEESGDHADSVGLTGRQEETCSGEVFFKCVLGASEQDYSDLVDFVEFKEGKDYSLWLKNREKYRRWRLEKTAVVRWRRKKMTMRKINLRKR
ncbi:uncharacterized protein LOC116187971 [Punica granatum]|uniref:DUF7812 domain-containing protein n=2 Tax=Punica granatum TaxID=22663 RepID=A0A218XR92_PUNGR|nr:uncharacterized protein LOC116187971 [Punica granatum]OWM87350.1 hypothetical protein CDL15_Pgr022461 [Punica granatum]PKI46187.1 hypothetical protein CRG98_033445 [Punica granatum]